MSTPAQNNLISQDHLDLLRTKTLDGIPLERSAYEARNVSYCPYSRFRVGCAILTESGEFIIGKCHFNALTKGANVENASYGMLCSTKSNVGGTICAERTAVVKAVTEGHLKFRAIGVVTLS
jgi:cytidine deaminase